jgi:hypothetical protein
VSDARDWDAIRKYAEQDGLFFELCAQVVRV